MLVVRALNIISVMIIIVIHSPADNFEDHPTGYYVAFTLWVMSAIVSTCYTFTWDIKMDWGLFEGKYKLRSELIYQRKVR